MSKQENTAQDNHWKIDDHAGTFDDPLLHCLVELTRLHHRPMSADALRAGLPLEDNRFTPDLFLRAAKRAGLVARMVKRPLQNISSLVLPAVALLHDRQACLLLDIDVKQGKAHIMLPEAGSAQREISLDELQDQYLGYAIFAKSEHKFDERTPEAVKVHSRHWFWGALMNSWQIYRDVLVASLLVNLFVLASPLFIMNVYDRVVPNNAIETLWVLAIGVFIVFVFDFLLRMLRGYFIDIASKKTDIVLSAQIFEKVLGLKMACRPSSVGAFANNLRAFEGIRDFITSATITTVIDLPFVVLFLLVISFIGGPMVIVPAVAIPIVILYGLLIQTPLRKAIDETFRASSQKNATLVESLNGAETIKTLGAEGHVQKKWEQAVGYIAKSSTRSRLLSASSLNVAIFIQQLAMIGVVIYGVYLIAEGELSMGALIACVILTGRALGPMAQVANLATQYHQARAALNSLNEIMEQPVDRPPEKSFISRPGFEGSIEFHNVNFTYPNQTTEALSNVSFKIQPGEHVALIGRVGSGKTTIEKLILGLYEPTSGAVSLDDIDERQIDPADVRRNIGYVPQDIMLFYGSLRDNIVYGSPYVDDEAVLKTAEIAGLNEFVNRHPMGFDMPVGERGDNLSGGQRQSVAIARGLILDPPILLMDEPSNAMDNTTEERLKTRLKGFASNKTMVLITHRASLLDLVDRLIVIEGGRVVADGPKAQVLEALKQGKLHVSQN